jgi:DNA uptake protein ComE-like DNA-binding protein
MTRIRFAGIACLVLAWIGTSSLSAQTKAPPSPSNAQMPKAVKLKPIDINTAAEEDFVLLGIDRSVAKKIILSRPYRAKTELVSKQLLTKDQYEKFKDSLVAKQPPKKK